MTQQTRPLLSRDLWLEHNEEMQESKHEEGEQELLVIEEDESVNEHESLVRLLMDIMLATEKDEFLGKLLEDEEQAQHLGYTIQSGVIYHGGQIVVPDDDEIRTRIISSKHDTPLAGHRGITKTIQLIQRNFTWKKLKESVSAFVQTCDMCNRTKRSLRKPQGLLRPLPTPERPWASISMDFVMPLPESTGFDAVLVVVDRLTKMAHFVPTTSTVDAEGMAKLVLGHIVKLHGLPEDIVSDRGSVFTSRVWELMCKELHIERKLSTAWHPQTDGQTERINQIMEQYLRAFCSYRQDDWVDLLPFAEFSYNNAESATTKVSPFAANYGFNPTMDFVTIENDNVRRTGTLLDDIRETQNYLKQEIEIAKDRYKHFADQRRRSEDIMQVGDMVWLSMDNIKTTRPMKKLDYQWSGPFKILERIKDTAYKLDLPKTMRIHNIFHPSKLKKYDNKNAPPRAHVQPPLALVIEDQEFHHIEVILDSRRMGRSIQYLVHWAGYGVNDQTWEPYSTLNEDAPDMIQEFHRRNPDKPRL